MIRGTTPTLIFTTPYPSAMIKSGYITFAMRGEILLDIPISDEGVVISDKAISVTLTQAQTLMFDVKAKSLVQIRLVLDDDSVVASNIVPVPIEQILKDGEI